MTFNKVVLFGNVGRGVRFYPEDDQGRAAALYFTLATNRGQNNTDWHSICCFGPLATSLHKFVVCGRSVLVSGSLQYWDDVQSGSDLEDGKRYNVKKAKVVALDLVLVGSKPTSGGEDEVDTVVVDSLSKNFRDSKKGWDDEIPY